MNDRSRQNPAYRSTQTGKSIMERNHLFESKLEDLLMKVKQAGLHYISDRSFARQLLSGAHANLIQCQAMINIQPPSKEAIEWAKKMTEDS